MVQEDPIGTKALALITRLKESGLDATRHALDLQPEHVNEMALESLIRRSNQINAEYERASNMQTELLSLTTPEQQLTDPYFTTLQWQTIKESFVGVHQQLEKRIDELLKDKAEQSLHASSPLHSTAHDRSHNQSVTSLSLRLPKLEISPFDGTYDNWPNFHDLFKAMVDENEALTPAMKMQHLKTFLKGEAADLIGSLKITDDNYAIAWATLKGRYDKSKTLMWHHLRKLKALPVIQQPTLTLLRQMRNTMQVSIDSITVIQPTFANGGDYLVADMIDKLSGELRKDWERVRAKEDAFPTLPELYKFLDEQIHVLEAVGSKPEKAQQNKQRSVHNAAVKQPSQQRSCNYCGKEHSIHQCEQFRQLSIADRQKARKEKQLCANCLGRKHDAKICRCTTTCRECGQKHHTLLHQADFKRNNRKDEGGRSSNDTKQNLSKSTQQTKEATTANNTNIVTHVMPQKSDVLLATAVVRVINTKGRSLQGRALLDSGAQSSFVSENLAQALRLPRKRIDVTISGLAGTPTSSPKHWTQFTVSDDQRRIQFEVQAYVLSNISAYTPSNLPNTMNHLVKDLVLADPEPRRGRVELLLGADVLGHILQPGLKKLEGTQVLAQSTCFGWVISGPVEMSSSPRCVAAQHATDELPSLLQRFWEIEESPEKPPLTEEDELCEQIFRQTTTREESGRFIVHLPFKSEEAKQSLGKSKHKAVAQWKRVEARLSKNPEAQASYDNNLQEYLDLDHMEEIPADKLQSENHVFLPHHAVFRDSHTTATRVVYNASSETDNGVKLNDVLCKGPKLQNEIADVLTNWRRHQFVYTADVSKMFRQIKVHPEDYRFQCIAWKPPGSQEIKFYQMKRVTFGVNCAPYLANRVVKAIVEEHKDEYPKAVEPLSHEIYVDDVFFGADTREEAREIRQQVEQMLERGCLELRKWASNDRELLPDATDKLTEFYLEPEDDKDKKVLGLVWSPQRDEFAVKVNPVENDKVTKRLILSNIARLFDPLGWLSPFVVRAKLIMQELWLAKVEWDDTNLPKETVEKWSKLCTELEQLTHLHVPRFIGAGTQPAKLTLVGFSDASKHAYSAVTFLRVDYASGDIKTNLLRAKSRVAPIKTKSIPRLELCGAVELATLIQNMRAAWLGRLDAVQCYTDSRIVLDWLAKHPSNWHTFVANRVSHIQTTLPDVKWQHVPTKSNPADLNSRGLKAEDLIASKLWWHGPNLERLEPQMVTPAEEHSRQVEVAREACHHITVHNGIVEQLPPYLMKSNSWNKLIRSLAYAVKYINVLRERVRQGPRPAGEPHGLLQQHHFRATLQVQKAPWDAFVLKREHIRAAEQHVFKKLQEYAYGPELNCLREGNPVSKGSPLFQLIPQLDTDGIMRVGGRLQEANLPFHQRHPIILPPNPVTRKLIAHSHLKVLHGALTQTLSLLRYRYWIVHGRNLTKAVISKCVKCARQKAQLATQRMSRLPSPRCSVSRPFLHTGVDYAGPLQMRNASGRGHQSHKVWVALFVCLSTKAIHLEVVNDKTTAAFLNAFKCFVARRGYPSDMYSDNEGAFQGSPPEMRRAFRAITHDETMHSSLLNDNIEWHFIPPHAPHFEGIWEAGVKSFKHHFRRVVGTHTLTWDEMRTVLHQIEACLNSRPLVALRDDPSEDLALTPGHFLIGTSLKSIPEPSLLNRNENYLTRWQLVTRMVQDFWKRWRHEYIQDLQRRNKWVDQEEDIKVEDIVLIRDEDQRPCYWPLGRVIAVYPGRDGLVRAVKLRTEDSEYTRPIAKLCKLPVHPPQTN